MGEHIQTRKVDDSCWCSGCCAEGLEGHAIPLSVMLEGQSWGLTSMLTLAIALWVIDPQ